MKYYALFAVTCLAFGQSTTSTYTTDLNGNKVVASQAVSNDGQHIEVTQSINGQRVPLEQTDVKIISRDGDVTVTETIVRKFDSTGHLSSTDRVMMEERKSANGSSLKSTTYRSDINGGMREVERKTVDSETQGPVTKTQSVIERPTINGSLQAVEKRSAVAEKTSDTTHADETVYRLGPNGDYTPAVRNVSDTTRNGQQTITKSAEYEPLGDVSKMQLSRQAVTTTTVQADGSQVSQVDHYRASVPGLAADPGSKPKLYEEEIIHRDPSGGGVKETVDVRRVNANDPNRLGPAQRISETVCTGKCEK